MAELEFWKSGRDVISVSLPLDQCQRAPIIQLLYFQPPHPRWGTFAVAENVRGTKLALMTSEYYMPSVSTVYIIVVTKLACFAISDPLEKDHHSWSSITLRTLHALLTLLALLRLLKLLTL